MHKLTLGALAAALILCAPAAAADWPYVQSHRGGSVRGGAATFAEESMPAFRSAWHRRDHQEGRPAGEDDAARRGPALRQAARRALNIEIKIIPGEADFDSGSGFATTVCDAILRSGISLDQIIIQSFYPPEPAEALATAARGYEWWSPSGVPTAQVVDLAHALGLRVVPWTIDNTDDVRAVKAAGADAVITNDPVMAKAALGLR